MLKYRSGKTREAEKTISKLTFSIIAEFFSNKIESLSNFSKKTKSLVLPYKIKKIILNPSILPGVVVFSAVLICGGKNLIYKNGKRSGGFSFGDETGFFGGADAAFEENNFLGAEDVFAAGESIEAVFESASLKQGSANVLGAWVSDQEISALDNPNNPSYENNSEDLREEIVKYTVLPGDTAGGIAEKFGISTETVLWANNLSASGIIKAGGQLDILPISGVKHKIKTGETLEGIAKKYKALGEEIAFFNGISFEGGLEAEKEIIVPGGELPESMQPKDPKKVVLKPAPSIAQAGQASGYFIYPAAGHNWGRTHAHNGIDISNPKGGPIYAAASGTVILADGIGYNGGYGKHVQIKHPNGVTTLYGHLSKIYVSHGEAVSQGAVIGTMGNTGRSTGTHLHFEVRGAKNPLARY